ALRPPPLPIPAQATSYENHERLDGREGRETRFTRGGTRLVPYEARRAPHMTATGVGADTAAGAGGEARVRAAGFPARKLLEEFDEGHPRVFDRRLLARLGTLDFVGTGRNAVFVGAPGTGKTHLAIGLGVRACQAGHRVLFATATEWAARLAGARDEGRLAEELSELDACPLLIVDEVGYLPFDTDAARLLFRLIAHRYERASLIVTSDRPLDRWEEIFGGVAPAMTDRLAHHAETVHLEGDSYRLRGVTSAG
ncbi:IS21-like element helper ATPase IstB, partial [Streptomyces caniscabiei]